MINTDKLLLIINPHTGRIKIQKVLLDLICLFSVSNYEVTVAPTQKRYDVINIIEAHPLHNLIVCCGGDGTINEAVNGLTHLEQIIPVGFIPTGTTNDFATTLEIPNNPLKAAERIIRGKNYVIDIGSFNDKYFAYIAAFGLFTSVPYVVPQEMKKTLGHFAYVLEGIKQSIEIPAYKMTIEYDGNILCGEFVLGTVTNSTSVAGLMKFEKNSVCLDDGKFEVLLVKNPHNDMQLKMAILGLAMQQYDERCVMFFRASKIKFSCDTPLSWCIDGEDGGFHRDVSVTNITRRISVRL